MNLTIKYRHPTEEHTTMILNNVSIELLTTDYINIIKPASFAVDGPSYMSTRHKLITSYFENINNEPKEQFSW